MNSIKDSTLPNGVDRSTINKANAQKSTGPRTDIGKQRSKFNALRHGLTGQTVVLPSEVMVRAEGGAQQIRRRWRRESHGSRRCLD